MKMNRKKILESTVNNKSIVFGFVIVVFVFCICLLPLINKGTYSSEDNGDSLSIVCPETAFAGDSIECLITLNAVSITANGVGARYSSIEGLEYVGFTTSSLWNAYDDVNYVESDGFMLISDGVTGNSSVGAVKFNIPGDAVVDTVYKVELSNIVIGDGDETEVQLDDVFDEVKIIIEESDLGDELSSINTLDNIKITPGTLNEVFDKDKKEYSATVTSESIIIEVTKTNPKSKVSGDGEIDLEEGENIIKITVTSESGVENVYTLTITREVDRYNLTFDSSLNIDLENNYIKYIARDITKAQLLEKITVVQGYVNLYSTKGNEKENDDVLATGDIVKIYSNDQLKEEYTISVLGDSTGDGIVDLVDLVQLRKHAAGWVDPNTNEVYSKTGVYYYSLDLNQDGVIDLVDIVRMRKINAGVI